MRAFAFVTSFISNELSERSCLIRHSPQSRNHLDLFQPSTLHTPTHLETSFGNLFRSLHHTSLTRYINMATPALAFDMEPFSFVRSPALNQVAGLDIARLYLHTHRLRDGVRFLGLWAFRKRLESLVGTLQCNWAGANGLFNRDPGRPNVRTGERSSPIPLHFILGNQEPETLSGDGMLRVVMNMVIFVVNRLQRHSPTDIPDEQAKKTHKKVVVAMFVEAIYALQHNQPSALTDALFGPLLVKVVVYSDISRRKGESDAAFHLRTVEGNLKEATDMGRRDDELHQTANYALKLERTKHELTKRKMDQDHRASYSIEVGLKRDLEEVNSRRITERKRAEDDLEKEKSKTAQLKLDAEEQKSKTAHLELDAEEKQSKIEEQKSKITETEHDRDRKITKCTLAEDALEEEKCKNAKLELDVEELRLRLQEATLESEHRAKNQKLDQTASVSGS
jgi:hypothetical protein